MTYKNRIKVFLKTATARLTLSYLLIIMLMSLVFSFVFYNASYSALGRQLPPPNVVQLGIRADFLDNNQSIDEFLRQRVDEGRRELRARLIGINILILIGGSVFSYYLARRTLKPIEENMEAQSQFVSDASHELRTPLTALQTTNEVAKLRQLTESLLNLAKNDGGDPIFALVDVTDVVTDALNNVINSALEKSITIDDKVPKINIGGDKDRLAQALTIILDNAIKYSLEDSNIHVTAQKNTKYLSVIVEDEGIGIKAVHLPHIFERFYRADSSRSKNTAEGFGIGLALAKKIIEQHNGEIIASSTPGKGSIFVIKLPLS